MSLLQMNPSLLRRHLSGEKPLLVEFQGSWCLYCRRLAPAMERLAETYGEVVTMGQVDIDREPGLATQYQIEVIPTFLLFRDGQVVDSLVSPEAGHGVAALLDEHLSP